MKTITSNDFMDEIDNRVSQKRLLNHAFYQAWTRGELKLSSLKDYVHQYYNHVKAFPTYLSAVHAQTDNLNTRQYILKNLMDEESGYPNHIDLWVQFGEGLGLSEKSFKDVNIWDETSNLINIFKKNCSNKGTAAGLAVLYSYESQIPEVSRSKIKGLKEFYGIDDEKNLAYFRVHMEADVEHSAVERELLKTYINESNADMVIGAVDESLDALLGLLDVICKRHGIAM